MWQNQRIAAVIPAYNEERRIGQVIETMPDYVDWIVVVDDASRDGTAEAVRAWVEKQPGRVFLLRHSANQGVGGAIASGYQWCCQRDVDAAVVMAGDAQMDPADLPAILEPVTRGQADYTKGNRLFTGEAWQQIPRVRYLGNSAMSLLTKIASGYWHVADSQSGYTAINARALRTVDWTRMYRRYGQPNDLLVRLNVYNFRVLDVPIRPVYHKDGKSGIRPMRMIPKLSWLLFKLFLWRMKEKYIIRDFHPLLFFYAMGLTLFPAGFIFGMYLFIKRILVGPVAETSALFSVFLIVTGLQSLFFAMWFDMEYNKHLH
ncbi:MAG: glycosyltransferase family 2 protein [Chloroflexi bacterium]|nr:glycosyltransferase family 2 protein [Chloroflexota bacterium]